MTKSKQAFYFWLSVCKRASNISPKIQPQPIKPIRASDDNIKAPINYVLQSSFIHK